MPVTTSVPTTPTSSSVSSLGFVKWVDRVDDDPRLPCMLCVCRHLFHVHDCWAVYVEAVSEETPRHQCQCVHRLRLPGYGHLLLRAGSGAFPHHPLHMLEAEPEDRLHISVVALCRCLGKATWFSGSFSLSSTFWPHSSSVHSSTIWAAGSWVTSQPFSHITVCFRGNSGSFASSTFPSHQYKFVVKCQVAVFCMCIVLSWIWWFHLCVCVRLWGAAQDRERHLHGLHQTVQRTHVHRESPPLKQADKNSKIHSELTTCVFPSGPDGSACNGKSSKLVSVSTGCHFIHLKSIKLE